MNFAALIDWQAVGVVLACVTAVAGCIVWLVKVALDIGAIKGILETRVTKAESWLTDHEKRLDGHDVTFRHHGERIVKLETLNGVGEHE